LDDEGKLTDLVSGQLVQIQIFQEKNAVRCNQDLMHGEGKILVGIRPYLDTPVVGTDEDGLEVG
jgi:hypothetical protein